MKVYIFLLFYYRSKINIEDLLYFVIYPDIRIVSIITYDLYVLIKVPLLNYHNPYKSSSYIQVLFSLLNQENSI